MSADSKQIVRLKDLVKDFRPGFGLRRKRVLHGISFDVCEGEIFGFVGPNGAGKTTTLKVLMGLIRATAGEASVLGCDVRETRFRRHIGFLPENPYFYDFLTGREILSFYAKLSGVARARRAGRVATLLDWVGLSDSANARLRTYSKGMLQRIGIAQALVHDPKVVFLDEPMSGLDPIGRKEIRDLVLRLRTEGKTVFMNTHILSDDFLEGDEREADAVVASLPAETAAALEERFAAQLRGHGDRIELRVAEKDMGEVLRLALGAGAEVLSVTPRRVSLESIFLSAVEKGEATEATE
jgi:ABC-2 type transport system ATP-binding protein